MSIDPILGVYCVDLQILYQSKEKISYSLLSELKCNSLPPGFMFSKILNGL